MLRGSIRSVSMAAWMIAQGAGHGGTGPVVLAIDTATSQVMIQVGKAGMLGFAGHLAVSRWTSTIRSMPVSPSSSRRPPCA
jgi:hypothetical protein